MKHKLFSFILLFTLGLSSAACNLAITPPSSTPSSTPATATAELNPNGVIFTAEQTTANLDVFGSSVKDTWTPTEADIAALEAALPAFLETAENQWLTDDPPIDEREPEYMRQYLGIVEEGEEIVYANFFCTINEMDWSNEYVLVMDGGDCFFQIKYNPATNEFFDFSVNGQG